jgi:hypothetical protein
MPNLVGDGEEVVVDGEVNFGLLPVAMVAGVLRAGRRRAMKKRRDRFREMTWCCWCLWQGWNGSVLAGRREAERQRSGKLTGAVGDVARVQENAIGSVDELQRATVVL